MLIGINVAKAELVVAARPSGERWTVANDEHGVRTLVDRLPTVPPELIVLEATATACERSDTMKRRGAAAVRRRIHNVRRCGNATR